MRKSVNNERNELDGYMTSEVAVCPCASGGTEHGTKFAERGSILEGTSPK